MASTVAQLSLVMFACSAHQPPPDDFDAWIHLRFPAELVSRIHDGKIRFEGGDGTSMSTAIVIVGATGSKEGVRAEYYWIAQRHGIQGRDWAPVEQSLLDRDGRRVDAVTIEIASEGSNRTYYFDIREFIRAEVESYKLRE